MIIVHIEAGLGNQMLDFADYMMMKKLNPNNQIYIENILFEIEECHNKVSMWNGYELENLFGIKVSNIKEIFNDSQWNNIIKEVKESKFWEKGWNYADIIIKAFENQGLKLENRCIERMKPIKPISFLNIYYKFRDSHVGYLIIKRLKKLFYKIILKNQKYDKVFYKTESNLYFGHTLKLQQQGFNIEKIDKDIRKIYKFHEFEDLKNLEFADFLKKSNSVAIHARRGDLLEGNEKYYKYGYFKKAIKYIKKKVENPVFIFFCEPNSVEWCKNNQRIFNLDFDIDKVYFVDWNKGKESYRDIQLMSLCKHNIITISSFGWWSAYFNQNPDKITCSPEIKINTTHHF